MSDVILASLLPFAGAAGEAVSEAPGPGHAAMSVPEIAFEMMLDGLTDLRPAESAASTMRTSPEWESVPVSVTWETGDDEAEHDDPPDEAGPGPSPERMPRLPVPAIWPPPVEAVVVQGDERSFPLPAPHARRDDAVGSPFTEGGHPRADDPEGSSRTHAHEEPTQQAGPLPGRNPATRDEAVGATAARSAARLEPPRPSDSQGRQGTPAASRPADFPATGSLAQNGRAWDPVAESRPAPEPVPPSGPRPDVADRRVLPVETLAADDEGVPAAGAGPRDAASLSTDQGPSGDGTEHQGSTGSQNSDPHRESAFTFAGGRPPEAIAQPFQAPAPDARPPNGIPDALPLTPKGQVLHVEVEGGELGPIQVRVALSDHVVHARVSTERADVGRFLVMRQGQLEATFHASGLDLGQFRVDVGLSGGGHFGAAPHGFAGTDGAAHHQAPPRHQDGMAGEGPGTDVDETRTMSESLSRLSVFA